MEVISLLIVTSTEMILGSFSQFYLLGKGFSRRGLLYFGRDFCWVASGGSNVNALNSVSQCVWFS